MLPDRRRVLGGLLATAAAVVAAAAGVGAAEPGLPQVPCRRVGQRAVVGGLTYVCVRRNGRLQWARAGASAGPSAVPSPSPSSSASPSTPASGAPPAGGAVAMLSALPEGRDVIIGTRDANGLTVDVVLRRSGDTVRAFDARCTHAGCIVAVDGPDLLCRCHGSVFDGASGARLAGPAPTGLLPLPVRIASGQVFVSVS